MLFTKEALETANFSVKKEPCSENCLEKAFNEREDHSAEMISKRERERSLNYFKVY